MGASSCGIYPNNETKLRGCQFFFEAPSFSGKIAEGLWNNDAKTLVLRLAENVVAATPLEFAWFLKNPEIGQDSPEISIAGQSENITLAPQRFLRDVANKSPLVIAKFERHLIQQSTSQAGVSNTFVVDLVFNVDFENANLVFSGLVTTKTTDQTLPISFGVRNHSLELAKIGAWTQSSGTLQIIVFRIQRHTNYTISFALQNPDSGQESPPMYAEVTSSSLLMTKKQMTFPNAAVAPLFVYGLIGRHVRQTSEFPGAQNRITVQFATTLSVESPSKITIKGLVDTQTSSGTLSLTDLNSTGIFQLNVPWHKVNGSVIIDVLTSMVAGVLYTLSFEVVSAFLKTIICYPFRIENRLHIFVLTSVLCATGDKSDDAAG